MYSPDKKRATKILIIYALGVLTVIIIANTPFFIPCIFLWLTGIPCPGCGLGRAFILASQFDFLGAIKTNILFLPLTLGFAAYFAAACIDLCTNKNAEKRLNAFLAKKWVIIIAVILTGVSWYLNISGGV
jgi:hypothetical protein